MHIRPLKPIRNDGKPKLPTTNKNVDNAKQIMILKMKAMSDQNKQRTERTFLQSCHRMKSIRRGEPESSWLKDAIHEAKSMDVDFDVKSALAKWKKEREMVESCISQYFSTEKEEGVDDKEQDKEKKTENTTKE
jgi:hypothetical protein